ncbi:MAG: AraC family transcriptional regulator ligand-binding domain-containing protein [Polyangiaceae bacterium]
MRPSPTVFAQALAVVVATAAARRGVAPAVLAEELGVSPDVLSDPNARVPHETLMSAWEQHSAGDEQFGLRAALLIDDARSTLVEYALANAGTALLALEGYVRFQRLLHDAAAHTLSVDDDGVRLRFGLTPPLRMADALSDFLAATTVLRFRRSMVDPVEPRRVLLPRAPLGEASLARQIFNAEIEYGAQAAEIHFPPAFVERKPKAADPKLYYLLVCQIERALGLPESPATPSSTPPSSDGQDLVLRTKAALRTALLSGKATLPDVAKTLGQSPRSLQRRLAERGTSFQAVLDDVRRVVAIELLTNPRASVTEVALTAGFSELSAFTRAFRRWTGEPPSEYLRRYDRPPCA